ncbi:SDR family NAD(P)-dependent oxidoreductase [Limosilactobacillus sp.]|jgi:short-subunit dehydrogenase|uniref:SDR family NAD(P)-dependent oxidoreductase n=1 Tax=Limosilactobacillus sp. TaxID=2773925 RepID=UPI0035A041D7
MANKTALITGATGGLGTELVKLHAREGGDLILVARNPQKLRDLQHRVQTKYGVKALTIAIDFTREDAAQLIFDRVKQANLSVDYLINNAGFGGQGTFLKRTLDQDINMARVNMLMPTKLMKLFLPAMVKRGHGRILNVSSAAAMIPGPLQAEYYATKAYLTSLSNALWYELKDSGVRVTTLMPGAMATNFAQAGGLTHTKMFANGVNPAKVAQEGYQAMLAGKMNIFAGLPGWQRPFVNMMPLMPKKMVMSFVANQQSDRK